MTKQATALLLCIAIGLPGCASARYSGARLVPHQAASPGETSVIAEYVSTLPTGSKIRVDVTSGKSLRGTLLKASSDELVIQRNTRVPVSPETIPMKEIARVIVEPVGSSNGRLMAIGASIGAGAAIGVVWLIALLAFGD